MRKYIVATLLLVSLCSLLPGWAQGETKAEEMRKRDRYHTAIMSGGAYSSPMSWDRKTIIITEAGQVVKEEIYAPNGKYYAHADLAGDKTTVFGTVWQGKVGRRFELWSMEGCAEMLGLSGDGDRLVLGSKGEDRAIRGDDPDQVILTFVDRGELIREVRLGEVATDMRKMQDADTAAVWGWYKRLNGAGHYVIEAADGMPILFEVETGERIGMRLDRAGDIDGWQRYVDAFVWFELQHPCDCIVKERKDFEGYANGSLYLTREDSGWAVMTDMEKIANYRTDEKNISIFIEFAIDRAKVMNSADGPTSTSYVDSVISQTLFTNPHGIDVLELLLSMVHADWSSDEEVQERSERGPIYAVLLAPDPDESRSVLFVSPTYEADRVVGSDGVLRKIVDTIKYPE